MTPMSLANTSVPPSTMTNQQTYNGYNGQQQNYPTYPPQTSTANTYPQIPNQAYPQTQSNMPAHSQMSEMPSMLSQQMQPPQTPAYNSNLPPQNYPPSTGGFPPSSTAGFPPSSTAGFPPSSTGGFPPPGAYPGGYPGAGVYSQSPAGMPPGQPGAGLPQRKINPDTLPSAIDVIENDRSVHSGTIFSTGARGVIPPLVTTEFSCRDEGNCNPRFIRSSLYSVPTSSDLLKQCGLDFTITCCPFARLHPSDQPVMLSDLGHIGPVRCVRCKAYMSPVMSFVDGGRKFCCPLCGGKTDCPETYFAHVDHSGRRTDTYQRPELCLGSYELTTNKDYCRDGKMPKPPAFIFVLDSQLQYKYMKQQAGQEQLEAPKSEVSVGFITYDRHLHFYSFLAVSDSEDKAKRRYAHPRMNIIADTDEMFVPGVEGFLVPGDNVEAIENLLQLIPQYFMGEGAPSPQPDPLLAPAIQAGLEALKAAERPGKLFVLHSNLPTVEAPGRLKNRDERKLIGTEKEKTLLNPANDYYTNLGKQCVEKGVCVDFFLMPSSYIDLATICEVPKLTGGHVYKYNCFLAETHGEDLMSDLRQAVSSPRAFDCVLRVRSSTGTRPVEFFCHGHVPNTTDVEVASMDCEWGLSVEIKYDDKLPDGDVVFIQAAVLFTSLNGQRRIRVHNLSLNTTTQAPEVFRLTDLDTQINFLAKSMARSVLVKPSQQVMEAATHKIANLLAAYRKNGSNSATGFSNPSELVLPDNMKLLPLYTQCLIKSDIVRPANEIAIDDRCLLLFLVHGMNVHQSATYFYPRLLPLHNLNPDTEDIPSGIRCSYERLQPQGAYLLDNAVNMFIWVGSQASQDWLQAVFGVASTHQIPEGAVLTERPNDVSKRVFSLVNQIRLQHVRYCRLIVMRQGDRSEIWLKHFMFEDRADNCPSYVDYLCHVHREEEYEDKEAPQFEVEHEAEKDPFHEAQLQAERQASVAEPGVEIFGSSNFFTESQKQTEMELINVAENRPAPSRPARPPPGKMPEQPMVVMKSPKKHVVMGLDLGECYRFHASANRLNPD
ncbi:Protein transport protein Sec24C [Cichlidogyrus casuarinus]|uniref:Protein transport protein Sec24C n=1 Tax=Cichlidogyrus casuarinus TaxID=1844966 RepID=A0ABD2Q7T3_9PLAT